MDSDSNGEEIVTAEVRRLDFFIQRAMEELMAGKSETQTRGLIRILAGRPVSVGEVRTRVVQKWGDGLMGRRLLRCFFGDQDANAQSGTRCRAVVKEGAPPEPTSPAKTSVMRTPTPTKPPKPALVAAVRTATSSEHATSGATKTAGGATAIGPVTARATSGDREASTLAPGESVTVEQARTAAAALVALASSVPPTPRRVASDGATSDAGDVVATTSAAAETAVSTERTPTAARGTPAKDDQANDGGKKSTMPVKAPSVPLPPGIKIPKKPMKIIDVRVKRKDTDVSREAGKSDKSRRRADARKGDKRRHSRSSGDSSRRSSTTDGKSSSSHHSSHRSAERGNGSKCDDRKSGERSSSHRRDRSEGDSKRRRRSKTPPRTSSKSRDGAKGRMKSQRGRPHRHEKSEDAATTPKKAKPTTEPRATPVKKTVASVRKSPRSARKAADDTGTTVQRAVGAAISAAQALTSAIVTCAALTLVTTVSTATTPTRAQRFTARTPSRKAAERRGDDTTWCTTIGTRPPTSVSTAASLVSTAASAAATLVRATGVAFSPMGIATATTTTSRTCRSTPGSQQQRDAGSTSPSSSPSPGPTGRRLRFPEGHEGEITKEMLRHALENDKNAGYPDYRSSQDCHGPLERRELDRVIVLSRQMPFRRRYLPDGVQETPDLWETVWSDQYVHWELNRQDFRALQRMDGSCHEFAVDVVNSKGRKEKQRLTVHPACGHVSTGPDFHVFCRTCQLCSEAKLCCTGVRSLCSKGKALDTTDADFLSRVTAIRKNRLEYIRDRGRTMRVVWLGDEKRLEFSLVRRLAYAVGYGAHSLLPELERMIPLTPQPELTREVCDELRALALQERATRDVPLLSSVEVIPLYLCGRRGYQLQMERLVGPLPSLQKLWEEYNREPEVVEARLHAATSGKRNVLAGGEGGCGGAVAG